MPPEPPGHAKKMLAICADRSAFNAELEDRLHRYLTVTSMEMGWEKPKVSEEQSAFWSRTVATLIMEMFNEAELVFVPRNTIPKHIDDDDDDDDWL